MTRPGEVGCGCDEERVRRRGLLRVGGRMRALDVHILEHLRRVGEFAILEVDLPLHTPQPGCLVLERLSQFVDAPR